MGVDNPVVFNDILLLIFRQLEYVINVVEACQYGSALTITIKFAVLIYYFVLVILRTHLHPLPNLPQQLLHVPIQHLLLRTNKPWCRQVVVPVQYRQLLDGQTQ